ncbi:MAG TPA: PDZ domain-containing protein [Gemmatimonadales bacterium]|nr:PDZ domain-containing protein [Gemmatimonadales bacterium]
MARPQSVRLSRFVHLALALVTLAVLIPTGGVRAQSQPPYLLQNPALSATQMCFTFAGDIWLVPRAGGVAHRLTGSIPGADNYCAFSPDGKWVAYSNGNNGNLDVYVIAAAGGTPKRLTWHPAPDRVRGWTPDGKVLFESTRLGIAQHAEAGAPRLFVQGMDEVAPTVVDLPGAWEGAFSPDGKRLAYLPFPTANEAWKRYRGGRTTPIWIADLADAAIEKVPRTNSTDQSPMWVGDTVFFISDRDGPASLYAYDVHTKQVTRRITNTGLDIKSASAGPGGIVYEQFGSIHLYDLTTGKEAAVPITPGGELSATLPRFVGVGDRLTHAVISPTGTRAAFEARGEIVTVPAKKGDARDITNTPGATERWPSWSPDGQTIAYFSDRGGAYHLELRGQSGMGDPKTITLGGDDTYYYAPIWSPDGKLIAYSNSRGELWYADVATGKTTKVDTDPFGDQNAIALSWSPDSKWIAYPRGIANRLGAVFVYDLTKATATRVTDGMSDARSPAFDASGKYLYFLASTDAGPASDFSMMTYDHPVTRSLYAIVLKKDLPSPLAPESDEEKAKSDSAAKDTTKGKTPAVATPTPVTIDFEAIDQRTVALPPPPRNYVALLPGKTGILVLMEAPLVPVDQQNGDFAATLYKFDLGERKTDQLLDGVGEFDVSRDGEKLLYRQKTTFAITALTTPIKAGDGNLSTSDIQLATDPRAEWQDMYHEAFRLQRAFFYDPSYHGLDLAATERFYARYLDGLGDRTDLDYLLREAFGNLTVGHLFVFSDGPGGGGGAPANGLLGADYSIDQGRWRFAKVYAGENWNPDLRAPLTQPGVNVRAGEYLLAVNGRDVRATENVDHAFEGMAGKQTVLRVGPNANGTGARDVTVVPVRNDLMLRHLAWIDANRRTVERLSGGKLAYIYVPNTANEGYTRFNRYFFAQQDKQGAIVDERFNSGGNIADYMVEYLRRMEPFNLVTSRYGEDVPIPAGAIYGPKAMLINEYSGSGGDELPWLFRRFKVGPLVGTRTWGGLVGIGGYPPLMDGGFVTAPRVALWASEGEYAVENKGVAPDVAVDFDPAAWRAGHDPQLERAVAVVMDSLAKNPPKTYKRPPYPTWAAETKLPVQ